MFRFSIILLVAFTLNSNAQKFADKNFYLVDSLVYENIAPQYQVLIDTNLNIYHQSTDVIEKLFAVNLIVKLCWDEHVWPKYNQWIYDFTVAQLELTNDDSVRFILLQAQAGALYYIGWNYSVATQYDKCIFYYEKCKTIYIEIKDSIGLANSIDNIGNIFLFKGELSKALDYYNQALQIRIQIDDKLGMGASRNNIGGIYYEHGDYLAALKEYKQALNLHKQANFISGVSTALNNLGSIELYFGNYDNALNYYSKSLAISTQLGDKQGMAASMTQIGTIELLNKNIDVALHYFENSLSLYSDVDDQRGISGCYLSIGQIYLAKNKHKKAIDFFEKGLTIATEMGIDLEQKNASENLFFTYFLLKNYDEAEKYLLQVIALRDKDVAINFSILPEQKKELYLATMAHDFTNLYAFATIRKNSNPNITGEAFNNVLKLKGLLMKSSAAMRQAILSSGDKEHITLFQQWIELKKQIAQRYASGQETELLENQANVIEADLIKISAEFNNYLNADKINWKTIQDSLKINEIAIEFIHYPSLDQSKMDSIYYAALVVTKTSPNPFMIELCSEAALQQILGAIQANNLTYVEKIYGTKKEPNHQLYQLIWKPLENYLTDVRTIYFSPSGILHKVAFQAISDDNNVLLNNRFHLVQLGSTAQILKPKSSVLDVNATISLFGGVKYSTEKTQKVIWNYLPGSLSEIDSIKNRLPNKWQTNYYSAENASEDNLKKQATSSNILHIASHGFFYPDPALIQKETYAEETEENLDFRGGNASYVIWNFVNNPNPLMRSGIALAGANNTWERTAFDEGEDGVLTAQEVITLNLSNTQLVVLSACETGLGDIKGSEGVYGLQRAFKIAGANYLIISLWQVPDDETAEFMIQFYTNLADNNDIRLSFTQTQKQMSQKYDPYYWAAFVLVE